MGEFRFGKCPEMHQRPFAETLRRTGTVRNREVPGGKRNQHRQPNDGCARSQTLSSPPWHATRETLLCLVSSSHPGTLRSMPSTLWPLGGWLFLFGSLFCIFFSLLSHELGAFGSSWMCYTRVESWLASIGKLAVAGADQGGRVEVLPLR